MFTDKKKIHITNKVKLEEFKKFLLSLNQTTKDNFNPFGIISKQNITKIVDNEIKRKDKIKFFSYVDNELISYGFLTKFEKFSKKHNCILGIVISDNWQNKGFGKKICNFMIQTAWKNRFDKIWLTVFSDNIRALKMYKDFGFEIEGVFIGDEKIKEKSRDVISMAIFRKPTNTNLKRSRIIKYLADI